jgi:cell shape-determining protein MreD
MLRNIVQFLIFAFVVAVLVYVGSALIQTVNPAHFQPMSALEGLITGIVLAIIFALINYRKQRRNS